MSFYFHFRGSREGAGGDKTPVIFQFHHAHPAGTGGDHVFDVAKGRDFDPVPVQHIENGFSLFRVQLFIIDFNLKIHG